MRDLVSLDIWLEVRDERVRAHEKHGDTSMESADYDDLNRLAIVMEEVGEVAKEFNDYRHMVGRHPQLARPASDVLCMQLRNELIQLAAMAGAWADAIPLSSGPSVTDHAWQPVRGHDDDPECSHRSDGTDATYCGRPEHEHKESTR